MKLTSICATFTLSMILAISARPTTAAPIDQGGSTHRRPLPKPGQSLRFYTRVDVKKVDKLCHILIDITGTTHTEPSPQGQLLVFQSLSRLKEGEPSCAKPGNAIKRYFYRNDDAKLLKVEECKTEVAATCATREPLPKDDWQSPEDLLECHEGAHTYIDTPWGRRLTQTLSCNPIEQVPGGGTSPIEFWTDETLFPVYPHLRTRQTLTIPAMGIEMVTDVRLVEFN